MIDLLARMARAASAALASAAWELDPLDENGVPASSMAGLVRVQHEAEIRGGTAAPDASVPAQAASDDKPVVKKTRHIGRCRCGKRVEVDDYLVMWKEQFAFARTRDEALDLAHKIALHVVENGVAEAVAEGMANDEEAEDE